ncbi:MAG: hypothetical protein H6709_07010 [Kofleriaceae bacterium]|nr:hypothetical protein [Myxococcales bacterium]MCB9560120.1 hypothetical protein [Kofleriaceae bacterium]MCB9571827.1 hypothetical protein [Kofleriaceae bacterium]
MIEIVELVEAPVAARRGAAGRTRTVGSGPGTFTTPRATPRGWRGILSPWTSCDGDGTGA